MVEDIQALGSGIHVEALGKLNLKKPDNTHTARIVLAVSWGPKDIPPPELFE